LIGNAYDDEHSWHQHIIAAQVVIVLLFEGKTASDRTAIWLAVHLSCTSQPRRTHRSPPPRTAIPRSTRVIDFRLVDSIPGDADNSAHPGDAELLFLS
jgi:hypothetical protein